MNNAKAATGATLVLITRLNQERQRLYVEACAGLDPETGKRVDQALGGLMCAGEPAGVAIQLDANACWRSVFLEGKPFLIAASDMLEGWLDADVLRLAGPALGVTEALVYPVQVWNRVEGSISFYTSGRLTARRRRVCEAFAHQAGLMLENAVLCDVLQVQLDQVQESRRQMTAAEERLRREVAELLHSRVQSRLLVAWHRLGECEKLLNGESERGRELLASARNLIDEVREQEIRRASHRLHPAIIQVGLLPAIRSLSGDYEGCLQISLAVSPAVHALDKPLHNSIPEGLRLTVYRVLAEALNNINGHASASQAEITLEINGEGNLHMTVRDNGCGFNPARVPRGLGLSVIAGRVEQVGGTFQVASAPGEGTTISASFPLDGLKSG